MPLPLGTLDTRDFEDMLEEARAMIPRAAPAWTDHNYHDPGITLIELFAWLIESDFYRLDRTPDANMRAFLRLAGVDARAAGVADTVLLFGGANAAGQQLPAQLQVGDASGGMVFQTTDAVFVSPATLVAVLGGAPATLTDLTVANAAGRSFEVFGGTPAHDAALYLAFDGPFATVAATLSFHLWAGDADSDRALARRIKDEYDAWQRDLVRDNARCAGHAPRDWRQHHSARTLWEYSTAGGTWASLADVVDETRSLTLSGFVRASAPLDCAPLTGAGVPAPLAGRHVIRCRMASGAFDCPPMVRRIAINAVRARHEQDVVDAGAARRSNGRAGQAIDLAFAPVVFGSTTMNVTLAGTSEGEWTEVAEWDRVGPHDRAYRLAPLDARITFGDGRRGRVPPAGAQVTVSYRTGGGVAGNVGSSVVQTLARGSHNQALVAGWSALSTSLTVQQPFAASGGTPAESLALAKARAVESLAGPDRAITLEDFESLALATPGVLVSRAFAIAGHHPKHAGIDAAGSVTVVVVPRCPDSRPVPSDELLGEVARYLDRRRPLTTEVHVVGPCYKQITVHARLHAVDVVDGARLTRDAAEVLAAYLHPLRGGPLGRGWPIGRAVYRSEVMAVLSGVAGVTHVDDVELQVNDEDAARCGNAEICPRGLVTSGAHRITIAERKTR